MHRRAKRTHIHRVSLVPALALSIIAGSLLIMGWLPTIEAFIPSSIRIHRQCNSQQSIWLVKVNAAVVSEPRRRSGEGRSGSKAGGGSGSNGGSVVYSTGSKTEDEVMMEMSQGGRVEGGGIIEDERSSGITATLHDFAGRGKYQEALALLRSMKEGGIEGTAGLPIIPTPFQYHKVILACKTARQWALALDLLREMRQISGMQVMLHTYGAVMDTCASAGQLDRSLQVAQWMEEAGIPLNKIAYTTLIKACAEAGQGHRALEVLDRLRASPVSLDYLGYLKVIELLGSSGLVEEAMLELEAMGEAEVIVADYRIYFGLVRNALAHGRVGLASRAMQMMNEVGCTPQASAQKLLWDSLIKGGHAKAALELLDGIGATGMSVGALHNTRLRLVLSAGDEAGAIRQLAEMARKNLHINDSRSVGLALRLFGVDPPGSAADALMQLIKALRQVKARMDVVHYTAAINYVGKKERGEGGESMAMELLSYMDEDGVKANDVTYTSLIHILGQAGDFQSAKNLLHRMIKEGVEPSSITVCALMNAYWKGGYGTEAVKFFNEMPSMGLSKDVKVYGTVMQTLVALGRASEVSTYMDKMMAEGLRPDGRIFSILAKTCFAQKDWRGALRLLKKADETGIELDKRFFTVLLDGLAKAGHVSKAWEVFRTMKNRGLDPNSFTYSALLKGYTEQGAEGFDPDKLNDYIRTFDAAVQEGMKPNIINYNALIEACGRAKDAEAAVGYFERLKENGFTPDVISWSVLVKAHANAGNFTGAFDLLDKMKAEGRVKATERTFNPLVDRCARAGRMDLVERALEMMRSTPGAAPDVVAYNSILTGMMLRTQYSEAEGLIERMAEDDVSPNVVTYNILVDHYAKAGFWERAFGALERMRQAGIAADTQTYNHLLDGLGRSGQFARAEETFERMSSEGLKPDTFTAMIMLDIYAKAGEIGKFDEFVELMRREKVENVPVIVAALIRTYLQHKKPEKAMSLLEERRKEGLPVQRAWHSFIVGHFFEEGRAEEAFRYLDQLGRDKLRLDGRSYAILARTLLSRGHPETAWMLLEDMKERGVGPSAELLGVLGDLANLGKMREEARRIIDDMVKAGVVRAGDAEAWFPPPSSSSSSSSSSPSSLREEEREVAAL